MKRTTTVIGLTASMVMLVLGAFTSGIAQAHTFEFSGTTSTLLLILGDGRQSFTVEPGATPVVCNHVHLDGTVPTAKQLSLTAKGTYTECEAAGAAATVSEAEYNFSADETVSVLKGILIEVPGLCVIHVFTTNNQNLSGVRYLVDPNSGGTRILAHAEVEKIHSVILGGFGLCGVEGLHTNGSYRGLLLAWAHNAGTLKWI